MTCAGGSAAHGVTSHHGRGHPRPLSAIRGLLWGPCRDGSSTSTNILSLLGAFVATSVVLGLLGAGLVMPAVGATGAVARRGWASSTPSRASSPPARWRSSRGSSRADGSLIATPYDENRIVVPLTRGRADHAPGAGGDRGQPVLRARRRRPAGRGPRRRLQRRSGGDTQGASTLTQQYVKITLQENALRNNDKAAAEAAVARQGLAGYSRKLQELKYAVTLEKQLTKDQILQGYLNLVYYGDQAYGVEAAARHYFGISATALNLPQAALLAGLTQRPGATDPVHFPEARPRPAQRRPGPHAPAAADHRQAVEPRPRPSRSRCSSVTHRAEHLRRLDATPTSATTSSPSSSRAGAGQDDRRAHQEHQPRRPDDPDHPRPADPGAGPEGARQARAVGNGDKIGAAAAVVAAGHRQGPGDGAEHQLHQQSRQGQDRRSTGPPTGVRRLRRVPVRLHRQDVRHRRRR